MDELSREVGALKAQFDAVLTSGITAERWSEEKRKDEALQKTLRELADAQGKIAELTRALEEAKRRRPEAPRRPPEDRPRQPPLLPAPALPIQPPAPPAPAPRKLPRMNVEFSGDTDEVRAFVWHARGFIADHRQEFPDEASLTRAIVKHLKGKAARWALAVLEAGQQAPGTAAEFVDALLARFRDPLQQHKATQAIKAARQGGRSVTEYVEEFRCLAAEVGDLPERMLVDMFKEGLQYEIHQLCVSGMVPGTLDEWMTRAMAVEPLVMELRGKKHKPAKKVVAPKAPKKTLSLSTEEKQRRFKLGLCLKCGEEGHRAADCGKQPAKKPAPKAKKAPAAPSKVKQPATAAVEEEPTAMGDSDSQGGSSGNEESGNEEGPQ